MFVCWAKGTDSFVTCGFSCLVLKSMTNLWGEACWRTNGWCHARQTLFFFFLKTALRNLTVCWRRRLQCGLVSQSVKHFHCSLLDICSQPQENTGVQTRLYTLLFGLLLQLCDYVCVLTKTVWDHFILISKVKKHKSKKKAERNKDEVCWCKAHV